VAILAAEAVGIALLVRYLRRRRASG
jgi:hypothetical protein